jgi:signal transduction histidine kinase
MFIFALGNVSLLFSFDPLYEQYKLFSMPIFAALVAYSIVKFKAFNAKLFAAQVLVVSLEILIISLLFIRSISNIRIITVITFIITVFVGNSLVKSFKRIDTQRELLEKSNAEQEVLMHFITHQIKGFFTKSRNIFDTLNDEADALSPNISRLVTEGLRSDKEGIDLVQNILNAANLKNGKITFVDNFFAVDALVAKLIQELEPSAKTKNLTINYYGPSTPLNIKADEARIKDVVRNVIQNAILYTFKGGVNISLAQKGNDMEFVVKDTGIGLSDNDKSRLFQSGGRGEESVKYNTSSTGYGLFIAKRVVDNYGGQISAESEGRDKGSKFTVVLPIVQTLIK